MNSNSKGEGGFVAKSCISLIPSLDQLTDTIIIALDCEYRYLYFNQAHRDSMLANYGTYAELGACILDKVNSEQDRQQLIKIYERVLQGEKCSIVEEFGVLKTTFFETNFNPIYDGTTVVGILILAGDVSDREHALRMLEESEERYRLLVTSMGQGLAIHNLIVDGNGEPYDYVYLYFNDAYESLTGIKREVAIGRRVREVLPDVEDYWIREFGKVALTGQPSYFENYVSSLGRYYSTYTYCTRPMQFAVLVSDITERKENERKIEYLSYRDALTGLFNRRFYEEELIRLDTYRNFPLSIILGDVNGLKLINDTYGHSAGDSALQSLARIFKTTFREDEIIVRQGGDEFIILLPKTSEEEAQAIIHRIQNKIESTKLMNIILSVSFGVAAKTSVEQNMETVYRNAENQMYQNKIFEGRSMRGESIRMMLKTLFTANPAEEKHAKRVSWISEQLAKKLGYEPNYIKKIRYAGYLHDLGKVGIDATFRDPLYAESPVGKAMYEKHSGIGARILSSAGGTADLSEIILDHHEAWDGSGYPRGIRFENIHWAARILTIVDKFDRALSLVKPGEPVDMESVLQSIESGLDSKFDPFIGKAFIEWIRCEEMSLEPPENWDGEFSIDVLYTQ